MSGSNESEASSYTTTSKKFLDSKFFVNKQQVLDVVTVNGNVNIDGMNQQIKGHGVEKDSLKMSDEMNGKLIYERDGDMRNFDDYNNEVCQRIEAVNFELDQLAKDAAIIEELDRQRVVQLDDQKVFMKISEVLKEALNGYENSDRMGNLLNSISQSRFNIERTLNAVMTKKQIATKKIKDIHDDVDKKIEEIKEDLRRNLKENEQEIDDEIASISDELKMQIQIELFREKKMNDLIASIKTSIDTKSTSASAEHQNKTAAEGGSYSMKQLSPVSRQIRNKDAISKYDSNLRDSLVEMDSILQATYKDSVKRRRRIETALESLQHSNWTGDIQTETYLSELKSLEYTIEKAVRNVENESRRIYFLKDQVNDDLTSKSYALSSYAYDLVDSSPTTDG